MKMAAVVNSKALPAEIVLDAVSENKVLGTFFGTNDQLSQTVKHIRKTKQNKVPDIDTDDPFFYIDEKQTTIDGHSFVLTSWSSEATNDRIVILGTNKLLEQLCKSTFWLIDQFHLRLRKLRLLMIHS